MSNTDDNEPLERPAPHKPYCPGCGSTDIRSSQTHKTLDFLLKSFSLVPHRCRSCRKRFYMRRPVAVDLPDDTPNEPQDAESSKAAPDGKSHL